MHTKTTLSSKKILVTGGLGFIGSNFIELALDQGYEVINIDKKTYAARTDLPFEQNKKYTFFQRDICNLTSLPLDISHIVNFAAESHVDNSINENVQFFNSNTRGVYNILELLRKQKKDTRPILIHISTDEVYGDILEGSYKESDRLTPSNPYSASKAAADELISGWGRTYDIDYRICRSSNNYGFGQYAEKLIPLTIKRVGKGEKMPIHGDGSYIREWTYVKDNCAGILAVMEKGKNKEIYNISAGENLSNIEVVKTILEAMKKPQDFYVFVDNRKGQDVRYSVDSSKVRNELGWKPSTTLNEYIPKYLKLCEKRSKTLKQGLRTKIKNKFQNLLTRTRKDPKNH